MKNSTENKFEVKEMCIRDRVDPNHPDWGVPSDLRKRIDAHHIECRDSLSGRWRPLMDRYWNNCVIPVRFRREADRG